MSDALLHVDAETRSAIDLIKCGAHRYMECPHLDTLCLALIKGRREELWWPGQPIPAWAADHIREGKPVAGWNCMGFERLLWIKNLGPKYGWPQPCRDQWIDVMCMARAMALPGRLGDCARILSIEEQKQKRGARLIKLLCVPQGWTADGQPIWNNDPELMVELGEYCLQDVRAEKGAMPHLRMLTEDEQQLLVFDSLINDRGLACDVDLAKRLADVVREEQARLNAEMAGTSEFRVARTSDLTGIRQLLLCEEGIAQEKLGKYQIQELLKDESLSDMTRRVLELRGEAAKASTAKLDAALRFAAGDGRMRGLFVYHRATTGRWAGAAFQPHNLPRASLEEATPAVVDHLLAGGDIDELADMLGLGGLEICSRLLRSVVVAPPGAELWSCDLSGIESRVLAWLGHDEEKLDVFRRGLDPYKYAAMGVYGVTYAGVTKPQRQIGKVAELSCGYQGGVGAFHSMAGNYGVKVTDEEAQRIVDGWRERHPMTTQFWRDLRRAAETAVRENCGHNEPQPAGRVAFYMAGPHLWCVLPSGRELCYPNAQISVIQRTPALMARLEAKREPGDPPVEPTQLSVTYETMESRAGRRKGWTRVGAYGGLYAENVTQAVARDILVHGLWRAEKAGFPVIGHVHDEGIFAPKPGADGRALKAAMVVVPRWAPGLPLDAEADGPLTRYRK